MADPSLHPSESPSGSSVQLRRPLWQIAATVAAGLTVGIAFVVVAQGVSPTTSVGRTSLATPGPSAVEVSPTALPTPGSTGLSEADAITIARGAAPHAENWPVRVAKAGELASVFTPMEFDWSRDLDPSAWIWQISLGVGAALDSQGTHVFLDFETGEVLWVMNTRG